MLPRIVRLEFIGLIGQLPLGLYRRLDFSRESFNELQTFNRDNCRREVISHQELFLQLHDHLPKEMVYERELLIWRL